MLISRRVALAVIGSAPAAAALPSSTPSPGAAVTRRELRVLTQDGVGIRVRELRPDSFRRLLASSAAPRQKPDSFAGAAVPRSSQR